MKIKAQVDVLDEKEMEKIKQMVLRMLHQVGLWIECPEAAAMMKGHGYRMDGQRLKPTPDETMTFITNYARSAARPCPPRQEGIVPNQTFGLGVADVNILDWETKRKRRGTLDDTRKAALFANGLDCVTSMYVAVLPAEIHPELAALASIVEASKYTRKASGFGAGQQLTQRNLMCWEEIGYLAAGGKEAYLKKPQMGLASFDISSPMKLSKRVTDLTRLTMKYQKLGGCVSTLPLQGLTGMVTLAGCVAQSFAETLGGGMFLEMIEREMTGTAHYAFSLMPSFTPADMHSAREACSAVENTLAHLAIEQMLEHLDLPPRKYNYGEGKTEAKLWDAQCGLEKMLNTVFPLLAGIGWGPRFLGELCTNDYFSFEQVIIDYELNEMGNRMIEGIRVDGEALNFDAFREGVETGMFAALEHTVRNYRAELYLPRLASRESYEQWESRGRKSIDERAHERVVEILQRAEPQPKYPPEVLKEMDRLLARFKEEFN